MASEPLRLIEVKFWARRLRGGRRCRNTGPTTTLRICRALGRCCRMIATGSVSLHGLGARFGHRYDNETHSSTSCAYFLAGRRRFPVRWRRRMIALRIGRPYPRDLLVE